MRHTIEQRLVGSRQEASYGNGAFVTRTMKAVKAASGRETFENALRTKASFSFRHMFARFRSLPVTAMLAIMIVAVMAMGGCVYAAVRFAPELITIVGKRLTERGTTEYNIPNFAACTHTETKKFELNKDAPPLSDDDVKKVVQARCELDWANHFVSQTWPTYGSHQKWQDGDDIYYARTEMMGTLRSATSSEIVVNPSGGADKTYHGVNKQEIVAYANGEKIALHNLKPGDTVLTVVRVAETYSKPPKVSSDGSIEYYGNNNTRPRTLGVIAMLKLSLPLQYYSDMQRFITEIPPCQGNSGEYCPGTGFIDVFPRAGGEGARNPAHTDQPGYVQRTISGKVIALKSGTLSLKGSSGKIYSVTAAANAFDDYNQHYAPAYKDMDATLQIGSTVFITYSQPSKANPQVIQLDQIFSIGLQIDASNVKLGNVKQY